MFKTGDVVYHLSMDKKMTVNTSLSYEVSCYWFDNTLLRMDTFKSNELVLYDKYIREKKIDSLINERCKE
jgi:uncharacterized protein YodC (DUF2158 family)